MTEKNSDVQGKTSVKTVEWSWHKEEFLLNFHRGSAWKADWMPLFCQDSCTFSPFYKLLFGTFYNVITPLSTSPTPVELTPDYLSYAIRRPALQGAKNARSSFASLKARFDNVLNKPTNVGQTALKRQAGQFH